MLIASIPKNRSLPESFSETFEGTIAPVDHQDRAFLNFIESHYTSTDLLPITLGKPRVLDPSATPPDISFGQIIFRGRVHDMIKKITVHLGANLLSTTVYVDFLFGASYIPLIHFPSLANHRASLSENPLACDFTIVSLDVKANTIGQSNRLVATASHSFSQPFMVKVYCTTFINLSLEVTMMNSLPSVISLPSRRSQPALKCLSRTVLCTSERMTHR